MIHRIHQFPLALAACSLLAIVIGCTNTNPTQNLTSSTIATDAESAESPAPLNPAPLSSGPVDKVMVGKFSPTMLPNGEASHITVQHVLIGFEGSVPGKGITRSKEEAATLAAEILAKAQAGENFAALVEAHTDDSPPGIYNMANTGQPSEMNPPRQEDMVFDRGGMVAAFGDTGFPLAVGEVGMASYDQAKSPYGWHVVKRIK